jgi:ribA/ribD-fused uncharacterized protein
MAILKTFYTPETGHTPLSNFSRHGFYIDGLWYETNEHWYQCEKTLNAEHREIVRLAASPGQAKKLAGQYGVIVLRPDWAAVRIPVMRRGLAAKFLPDNEPGEYLLDTGDALLIEGNTWGDRFWGQVAGDGANWLGQLLMSRRAELRWMRGDE